MFYMTHVYNSSVMRLFAEGPYLPTPKLLHTISGYYSVYGLTVLFDEVFLVRSTATVEVYNIKTWSRTHRFIVPGIPQDMTSCSTYNCLFISDMENSKIYKYALNGTMLANWNAQCRPEGLSVTSDCHVLVSCPGDNYLVEFDADGKQLAQISLKKSMFYPQHAIRQSSGQLIVCNDGDQDPRHRHQVCALNSDGNETQHCHGNASGAGTQLLSSPQHLAIDGQGNVLVADHNNHRIVLLSGTLKYLRDLITMKSYWEHGPHRIWLDDIKGRLFVAHDTEFSSNVLVLQVKH